MRLKTDTYHSKCQFYYLTFYFIPPPYENIGDTFIIFRNSVSVWACWKQQWRIDGGGGVGWQLQQQDNRTL